MPKTSIVVELMAASMAFNGWTEPQDAFRSGVELITIPITVTDSSGRRIGGLSQADFRLEEDGVAQEIAVFLAEPQPVSIALLVDYSASMRGDRINAAIAAIRAVGEAMKPSDHWSISTFADRHQLVTPWEPFSDGFFSRMQRLAPSGGTRLYDAVMATHRTLETAPTRKRAMLVISDGNDIAAQIGSDFSADLNSMTGIGRSESDVTSSLRRGESLLYAFGMDWPYQPQPRMGKGPSEHVDRQALERLAHPTGGAVWMPKSRQELVTASTELMAELREQYTLGYSPRKAADGRYRRIKVMARNPEHHVRHRTGYLAARTLAK
jgi:Ca-activated chloride channel family protein